MAFLLTKKTSRAILIASAGAFAGLHSANTLISVPAVLASTNPLQPWRVLYKRGSKVAEYTVYVSAAVAMNCFVMGKMKDLRYLICGGLNLITILWTVKFTKPQSNKLLALKDSETPEESAKVTRMVFSWSQMQWVPTLLGLSSFLLTVYTVVWKKQKLSL